MSEHVVVTSALPEVGLVAASCRCGNWVVVLSVGPKIDLGLESVERLGHRHTSAANTGLTGVADTEEGR